MQTKRTLRVILCCCLAAALTFAAFPAPARAAVQELTDEKERAAATEAFNRAVNRVKWDRPFGLVTYTNGVPKNGITVGGAYAGDDVDAALKRWLIPYLEGLFNNKSNLSQSFVMAIFGGTVNPETKTVLSRGMPRDDLLPLYGTSDVSRLSPANDDYSIYRDTSDETGKTQRLAVLFPETPLSAAEGSSLADVFSLPNGTPDPVIIGERALADPGALDGLTLTDFRFRNARAAIDLDENGLLSYYGSAVDYTFDFSFNDAMRIVTAFLGYDLYHTIVNTINTVYANLGKTQIEADRLLQEKTLHVVYRCTVEISDLNWRERLFGDVDHDGSVTADDARKTLRHCVGLEMITAVSDLVYTDVDFDGDITAGDARQILRACVGLEPQLTDVPDGKRVMITRAAEEAPAGQQSGSGWFSDVRVDTTPGQAVQSIFDMIALIRDTERGIRDIADQIKDAANG